MSLRRYCLLALLTASASAVAPAVSSASAATLPNAAADAAVNDSGSAAAAVSGDDAGGPAYGPELQGFDYPAPVERFDFTSQGVPLQMAYMDVKPAHPNGRT